MSENITRVSLLAKNKVLAEGQVESPTSWLEMQQPDDFVDGLDLPRLQTDSSQIYTVITGVPSPWARSYMMYHALRKYYPYEEIKKQDGFHSLYACMQGEYKGLITFLALYNSRITVKKVEFKYSDVVIDPEDAEAKNPLLLTKNIFEVAGSVGNMLFDELNAWRNPKANEKDDKKNNPYIQLIQVDDVVIGATTPKTLLYPSARYNLKNQGIKFYEKGKFVDPLEVLDAYELEKIYHYIGRLKEKLDHYESLYPEGMVNTLLLHEFFREWAQEIKNYVQKKFPEYSFKEKGILDFCDKFDFPFSELFNLDTKIYKTKDGRYLIEKEESVEMKEFNPDLLLLDNRYSKLIHIDSNTGYNNNLATVLKAKGTDEKEHIFALPLSSLGLKEFYHTLNILLSSDKSGKENKNKNLSAIYNVKEKTIDVTLELEVSGIKTPFTKTYKVFNPDNPVNSNVILWPNFISPAWTKYYMYSDVVHDTAHLKAIPIISAPQNPSEIFYSDKEKAKLYYITDSTNNRVNARELVFYDDEKMKGRNQYEIYYSETPFKGIELRINDGGVNDIPSGYVLIDSSRIDEREGIVDYSHNRNELNPVIIGIDFGSTNTCLSYKKHESDHRPELVTIKNKRRFLLGRESNDNTRPAKAHELFFFQNDNQHGIIRSALLLNNELRLKNAEIERAREVTGGFPIFETNLKVAGADSNDESLLNLNIEVEDEVEKLLYDLKWKREDRFLVHKKAFLKMIWLYVNAEMFSMGNRPDELLWAYPVSMPKDLRLTYRGIYNEIVSYTNPIKNCKTRVASADENTEPGSFVAITESEAVCNFALSSGGIALNSNTIFIGFDVGGLTTDILILGNEEGEGRAKLIHQTSVKLAADRISRAVRKSASVQKLLKRFGEKHQLNLVALQNINQETAIFVTNLLFEKIETDHELEASLYRELWAPENPTEVNVNETRGLIAIASFACGLVLYYSGQIIKSMIETKQLPANDYNVRMGYFGKGGKIFQWLEKALQSKNIANEFYKKSFKGGLGKETSVREFSNETKEKFMKLEVAYGLTKPKSLAISNPNSRMEIVGEEGYSFNNKPLQWNSPVTPEMIYEFAEKLQLPQELNQFSNYLSIYFDLVKDWGLFDHTIVHAYKTNFADRRLENYVKNDVDWVASNDVYSKTGDPNDFKFSCSPFLYQGMCYLDKVLMNKLFEESGQPVPPILRKVNGLEV